MKLFLFYAVNLFIYPMYYIFSLVLYVSLPQPLKAINSFHITITAFLLA